MKIIFDYSFPTVTYNRLTPVNWYMCIVQLTFECNMTAESGYANCHDII